jgi:transcriptional regulator with XRE-family HTH domain
MVAMRARRTTTEVRSAIPEALSLRELRRALRVTQSELARRLGKGQEVVSRIEQRQDMLLSTLRDYATALGGELELVCRFGNRAAVRVQTVAGAPVRPHPRQVAPSATEIAMAVTAPFAGDAEPGDATDRRIQPSVQTD